MPKEWWSLNFICFGVISYLHFNGQGLDPYNLSRMVTMMVVNTLLIEGNLTGVVIRPEML